MPISLMGANVIFLFCIYISLITSDLEHLFPMFVSHLHFLFWELSKWILTPYKQQLLTRKKKHRKPEASVGLLPQSLGTWLRGVSEEQAPLTPSPLPVPIISSPVPAATCLSHALVSL